MSILPKVLTVSLKYTDLFKKKKKKVFGMPFQEQGGKNLIYNSEH